jgi:endonuclease YncB( thermonuclease family)
LGDDEGQGEGKNAPRMPVEPMPAWAGGRRKRQPYVRPRWSAGLLVPLVAVALLLAWVASPPGLPSGPITGKSRVIDGDTLDVGNRRIRLAGIDAPERAQQCRDAAQQPSPCGETARRTLADLVGQGSVTCAPIELDRYSRVIATCHLADADLGEVMVGAGQAVANGRYADVEREARVARRGIWAGTFDQPADWRRAQRIEDASGPPQSPITTFVNWVGNVFFR